MTSITARVAMLALLCALAIAHPTSRTYYAPRPQASTAPKVQFKACSGQQTLKTESTHSPRPAKYHTTQTSGTQSKPSAHYAPPAGIPQAAPAAGPVQKLGPSHAPPQQFAPASAPTHNIKHIPTTKASVATERPRPVLPGSSIELENVSASATGNNSMSVGAEKDRAAAAGNAADGNVIMAAAAPGKAMGIIVPATPMF